MPQGNQSLSAQIEERSTERTEKTVAVVTIVVPFIAVLLAAILYWRRGVSGLDVLLCLGMYFVTMLGITMGFHRLFTHRSFQCVWPLKTALGIAGSMAAQGPILFWVACHRRHHNNSDKADDPHSPLHHGGSVTGVLGGWLHSHVWWMFTHKPENYFALVPDLLRDGLIKKINKFYLSWIALGLFVPFAIAGIVTKSWLGASSGLLWGGFVRLFLVHHSTWSINSVCHMFGSQPFETRDGSRNNQICAILTLGEGFHNNHHAFPASARHGLKWWQFDLVYQLIRVASALSLVWDVRLPTSESAYPKTNKKVLTPAVGEN